MPIGAVRTDQVAANQVRGGKVIVAGHGVDRATEFFGHVADKAGFTTAGGAFDQYRQAVVCSGGEQFHFVAGGLVEGHVQVPFIAGNRVGQSRAPIPGKD